MDSVFFIPTNRNCAAAVASYVKEVEFAQRYADHAIPLVVVETDDGPHVPGNAAALRAATLRHPDVTTYHLTVDLLDGYLNKLLDGEPSSVADPLRDTGTNYGAAMNRLFLLTGSFGAQALHRRDSDTRLVADELDHAEPGRYPIEVELDHLGRRLGDLDVRVDPAVAAVVADKEVWVVGGNYVGEWNLDVKDLAVRSMDPIHRLYEILGFDPEFIPQICAEAFPAELVLPDADRTTAVLSVNDGLNPDCGNVAVYRLHEHLPTVPGHNMAAADYFSFDVATSLGLPSVHHTRAVFHQYTSERFDHDRKLRYWEGVARFADYFAVLGTLFDGEWNPAELPSGTGPLPAATLEAVARRVTAARAADHTDRATRIRRLAEEILTPADERYALIGRHLTANASRYVTEADADYRRYEALLERWPTLVDRAASLDVRALGARPVR